MNKPLVVVDSEAKALSLKEQYEVPVDTLVISAPPLSVSASASQGEAGQKKIAFSFRPLPATRLSVEKLLAARDRDLYLALSPDLQGEYISWMLTEYLSSQSKGAIVPRHINLAGLSAEEITESFRLIEPVHSDMASTFFVRTLFDGCLQKHLQRMIGTRVGPGNLPLNLNSLTTLFLLADREREIETYASSQKWQVMVKSLVNGSELKLRLDEVYDVSADGFFKDGNQVRGIIESFKDSPLEVGKISKNQVEMPAPGPFRLTELMLDAYLRYKIAPEAAVIAVRTLYDGVKVGGRQAGLISSMKYAHASIINGLVVKIRKQAMAEFGEDCLSESDENENVAAECLYPLRPALTGEDLDAGNDETVVRIYDLIRHRALASQMVSAVGQALRIEMKIGDHFRFGGSVMTIEDEGHLACYRSPGGDHQLSDSDLDNLTEGQKLPISQIIPEQASGFPPEYYTFDTLYSDLVDFAAGVEGYIGHMLQQLLDGEYIKVNSIGGMRCTENVAKVVSVVNRALPTMPGINLSAYLEQTIGEVMSGRKPLDFALQQFDQTLFIHGKVLVKIKMPTAVSLPKSRSSRIIKSVGPAVEDEAGRTGALEPTTTSVMEPLAAEDKPEICEEVQPSGESIEIPEVPEVSAPAAHTAVTKTVTGLDGRDDLADSPAMSESAQQADAEIVELPAIVGETSVEAGGAFLSEDEEWPEEIKQMFDDSPGLSVASKAVQQVVEPAAVAGSQEVETKDCVVCGRKMILKQDQYGKFWTCTGFPSCRHSESFDKGSAPEMSCPICKVGKIISKTTPTGKHFYVCPEQDCEFMAWTKPHAVACQVCGSPFLVEKQGHGGALLLRCPRAGCGYMQPLAGGEAAAGIDGTGGKKKIRVRRVAKGSSGSGKKRLVRVVRRK